MKITIKDIDLIYEFYNQFWLQESIVYGVRPNIMKFVKDKHIYPSPQILNMLAMFYFRFWMIKYVYIIPTQAEIITELNNLYR